MPVQLKVIPTIEEAIKACKEGRLQFQNLEKGDFGSCLYAPEQTRGDNVRIGCGIGVSIPLEQAQELDKADQSDDGAPNLTDTTIHSLVAGGLVELDRRDQLGLLMELQSEHDDLLTKIRSGLGLDEAATKFQARAEALLALARTRTA